jgi:hypothetical protein
VYEAISTSVFHTDDQFQHRKVEALGRSRQLTIKTGMPRQAAENSWFKWNAIRLVQAVFSNTSYYLKLMAMFRGSEGETKRWDFRRGWPFSTWRA